nr:MAG TPA: hypothetical protein [Caudoviricetes sp.]
MLHSSLDCSPATRHFFRRTATSLRPRVNAHLSRRW